MNYVKLNTHVLAKQVFVLVILCMSFCSYGQINLKVTQIKKLQINGFNVKLNSEGNKLLYSSSNFKGLQLYDMEKEQTLEITDKEGSGYEPVISKNKVYYKTKNAENYITVSFNDQQNELTLNSREEQAPEDLEMLQNDHNISAKPSSDLTSIIVKTGAGPSKKIAPLGNKNYINVSVSPDGSKLLFRVSGLASFVSTLDGQIIKKLEDAEFPLWFSNDEILYAEVKDDGYNYIESDLFIQSLDSEERMNLTIDFNEITLYPSTAAGLIAFNTPGGDIFLMTLEK